MPLKTLVEAEKFTAWYDAVEDRLRLAVNIDTPDARVDFWITRRLFLSIISQLEDFADPKSIGVDKDDVYKRIEKGMPSPKVADEKNSNSDSVSSKNDDNSKDILKDTKVSLLRAMNISWNKKKGRVSLVLVSDDYEAESNLDTVSMTAFIKMLLIQAPTVEWGISSIMLGR